MATVTTASITDKVATLVLDDATGLVVGETVIVFNVGNHFDGMHTLTSVNLGTDTITYSTGGQDVAAFSPDNGLLYAEVTWIDENDVEDYLGYTPTAQSADEAYLDQCVKAANCYAYRERKNAGYKDNPTAAPCESAKLGTILFAGMLFRQKGSVDGFQSYQDMTINASTGNHGEVKRLLGINRAQVG